jgi:hypothetical protein
VTVTNGSISVPVTFQSGTDAYTVTLGAPIDGTPPPSTDLALGRPTTVSSVDNAARTGNLAVDGNAGTRWSSGYADPQWIGVDLGSTYSLSRVRLNWEAAYGKAYQIQTSADGSAWTTVYATTTGDGGVDDVTLAGSGRFVRVYGTARGLLPYGYSLWDLNVYGTAVSSPSSRVEAESFSSQSGTQKVTDPNAHGGVKVGFVDGGDWVGFANVNPSGQTLFTARVASGGPGGTIAVRTGSATGPVLGSVTVPNTGGYGNFVEVSTAITAGSGPLYLVFTGTGGGLFDVDDFALTADPA